MAPTSVSKFVQLNLGVANQLKPIKDPKGFSGLVFAQKDPVQIEKPEIETN